MVRLLFLLFNSMYYKIYCIHFTQHYIIIKIQYSIAVVKTLIIPLDVCVSVFTRLIKDEYSRFLVVVHTTNCGTYCAVF
jgi:hypothetical protein